MAKPDWEAIEREWRANQLSVREIGRSYHVSHVAIGKRAKKDNWQRDLGVKVRETVRESLLRDDAAKAGLPAAVTKDDSRDDEIVRAAAARHVQVVREHQASLGETHALVKEMLADLKAVRKARDGIADVILSDKSSDKKKKQAALRAIGLGDQADTLATITGALSRLIPLERKAFNIDEARSSEETPLDELRKQISGHSFRPVE